jgi:hypothetical protein
MLIAGGLFAGGAATFAWSRVPIWRRMPVQRFIGDFEETLRRTDKVQPALLVAAIVSAAGFALAADGSARVLALVGAAGFVATLAASIAISCRSSGASSRRRPRRRKRSTRCAPAGFAGTSAARCSRWRHSSRSPWQQPCDSRGDETGDHDPVLGILLGYTVFSSTSEQRGKRTS